MQPTKAANKNLHQNLIRNYIHFTLIIFTSSVFSQCYFIGIFLPFYNVIVQSFPPETLPLDVSTRWEIYAHHLLVTVVPPPVEVGEILFRVI